MNNLDKMEMIVEQLRETPVDNYMKRLALNIELGEVLIIIRKGEQQPLSLLEIDRPITDEEANRGRVW